MRKILNESRWGDSINKVKSAKLNKEIEKSLFGLIYCYYINDEKCDDTYSDFYGYSTKYCNTLEALTDDNVFDIMYEPKVRYETKLQTLVDYICDTYGKNSIKESKYKVGDFKNTSNRQISISYVDEEDNPLWVGSPDELDDCDYLDYNVEEVGEEGKTLYLSIEESKKSARKSIKEASDDDITVKEFCFWGHSGNMVEIWTIDGVLCDAFEVRNVGKSEYKNYEIHGWDCAKNTVIIYIKK